MCIDTKERVKAKGGGSKFFSEKTTSVDHVLTIWRVLTRLSLFKMLDLSQKDHEIFHFYISVMYKKDQN